MAWLSYLEAKRLHDGRLIIIGSDNAVCRPDEEMAVLELHPREFALGVTVPFFDPTQDRVDLLRGLGHLGIVESR
jgi:hypothetical protein